MIRVKPYIEAMGEYKPPWKGIQRRDYLRLDLNEYTKDTPGYVIDALTKEIQKGEVQMYPEDRDFLEALSLYAGWPKEGLMLTNGSDQAIEIILRAFLGPGSRLVVAQPEFPIFSQVAGVIGAIADGPFFTKNLEFPYESFLEKMKTTADLVVFINPNNPTGTPVSLDFIKETAASFPDTPILVDEAYYEYTGVSAKEMVKNHPNLIITRTFSKAFAIAGLRLGYIMADPELIRQLYKIRGPFDVNSLAMVAAMAQMEHPEEWKASIKEVTEVSMPLLKDFFTRQNVVHFASPAHFLLVAPKNRDHAVSWLMENGILVRPMTAELIRHTFRMNAGDEEQTGRFIRVYASYLETYES